MEYQITSDNIEISESMKALALEKFAKFESRTKDIPEGSKSCRIVMNKAPEETFEVRVEVILNGVHFFSDETHFSLETALILVIEELERQLNKNKIGQEDGKAWEEQREAKRFPTDEPDNIIV